MQPAMLPAFAIGSSRFRHELQSRRRLRKIRALARKLDPAMNPLFAFLHDREVDRLAGLQIAGEESHEDEFVVFIVREISTGPVDLGDAFTYLRAIEVVTFGVLALDDIERPAGLRHRLDV